LTEPGARFLVVTERGWETPVAFCHFRFTVQGEVMDVMAGETTLYVWDIHVEEQHQRKGLGKHLLTLCELIAKREKMKFVSIPVMNGDDVATSFIKKSKGYMPDTNLFELLGFDSNVEGFNVYAKSLDLPKPKPVEENVVNVTSTETSTVFDTKVDELSKNIGDLKVGNQTDENTTNNNNINEEKIKVDSI
jgi:GNAT superfamily N-acetyltransferase